MDQLIFFFFMLSKINQKYSWRVFYQALCYKQYNQEFFFLVIISISPSIFTVLILSFVLRRAAHAESLVLPVTGYNPPGRVIPLSLSLPLARQLQTCCPFAQVLSEGELDSRSLIKRLERERRGRGSLRNDWLASVAVSSLAVSELYCRIYFWNDKVNLRARIVPFHARLSAPRHLTFFISIARCCGRNTSSHD